jgi:ADP-ribose pyrophosphatase YjhB (NUDIX family)
MTTLVKPFFHSLTSDELILKTMNEVLPEISKFNIRVYGIFIRDQKVLMVKENMNGHEFTKFPGGGLEFGEGLLEGLKREIREELDLDCEIGGHFYTTDFFQRSAFYKSEQLISVYYFIDILNCPAFESFPISFPQSQTHQLEFFWIDIKTIGESDVTFPVDKMIVTKLKAKNQG